MIINLLNTIAIAFSIGTSANNTKFNYEKKSHKNAVETINITKTFEQLDAYYYETQDNNSNTHRINLNKYIINNNQNYVYYDSIGTIVNTTYIYLDRGMNQQTITTALFSYYKIINYYDSNLSFTLDSLASVMNTPHLTYWQSIVAKFPNGNDIDTYMDLTLNGSTIDKITSSLTDQNKTNISYSTGQMDSNNTELNIEQTTTLITLAPQETIGIMFFANAYTSDNNNNVNMLELENINIQGSVLSPDINYGEIVDIPGLMFTVIGMPFAFIQQAFDLTVFPGTPYQINFTNLFMTFIAVFVLLWLIKRILK